MKILAGEDVSMTQYVDLDSTNFGNDIQQLENLDVLIIRNKKEDLNNSIANKIKQLEDNGEQWEVMDYQYYTVYSRVK